MIGIAIKTFIFDIGLNLMFETIQRNFAKPVKVSIGHDDPEYLIVGEPLLLYFVDGSILECTFSGIIGNKFFVITNDGEKLWYLTTKILAFDRLDYDEAYDGNGWIDINDDDRITDEQIIKWLKEKQRDE